MKLVHRLFKTPFTASVANPSVTVLYQSLSFVEGEIFFLSLQKNAVLLFPDFLLFGQNCEFM